MTEEIHTQITAEEIAHVFEEEAAPVDLSHYAIEDWVTLAVFWLMAVCVFLQFFTRYVLNNSLAWTEEIAINCLIGRRLSRLGHVRAHVAAYPGRRALSLPAGGASARALATLVDIVRIGFFAYACWLIWRYVDDRRATSAW